MSRISHVLLQVVLWSCGAMVASAGAQEELRGAPTEVGPEMVLNDRAYEVELLESIYDVGRRVRGVLVGLELDVANIVAAEPGGWRQFQAGNRERIVEVEISTHGLGRTRISVTAVRVTPMRGAEVVEDPAYAKLVLRKIIGQL